VSGFGEPKGGRWKTNSLPLALAGGWAEAEAFAEALPESFPLLIMPVILEI